MKLTTSSGKMYEADWIDVASLTSGNLLAQVQDDRPLHLIAAEFDGLEWLKRESETQGDKEFVGFNRLIGIMRNMYGAVQLTLSKGG